LGKNQADQQPHERERCHRETNGLCSHR
jgi:hypothetical protein